MAKTSAVVLDDGEVIAKSKLDQYAVKGKKDDGSKQIILDRFGDSYNKESLVTPLYNPEMLAELLEINTAHYRACKTKARDTSGIGWYLEPKEDKEGDKTEKKIIEEFLNRPHPDESLSEVTDKALVDFESTGNGYFEVVRDENKVVVYLIHIPSHTVRRHIDEIRYVQERNGKRVWFKKFGEEKELDANTGDFQESIENVENRANEILHIKNYTSRSDYYGLPDVISALGSIIGDRERQEYNISFFDNHAIPAYAVTVSGAELDEDTEAQIKDFFQTKVKESRHSTIVLSAKKDEDDPSEEPVEFKFEALSTDTKETSFRMFRQDNRDEILSAHGVPPYRAGMVVEGQMGGSSADETTEIYKQSVILPKQERLEDMINLSLIQEGLGCYTWVFKLKSIDNRDVQKELSELKQLFEMGALSPNEVREAFGREKSDDPVMDDFYLNGQPIGATVSNGGQEDMAFNSVKKLRKDLTHIAHKSVEKGH